MQNWYLELTKPWFAPEPWVFGLAWGIIYPFIIVAFAWVIYLAVQGQISKIVLVPLLINIVFNLSFTYVQFGLQNNFLAMTWIIVVLLSLGWVLYLVWPVARMPVVLLLPYAGWGTFATCLQISITYLNR